jgi:predicted phage-related endonuclease
MADEILNNPEEATELPPRFPEDIEHYTAFLSEQGLAWVAVLLEGQAQILAHLRGTKPEEEKKLLVAMLPGKQAAVRRSRDPDSGDLSLSGA